MVDIDPRAADLFIRKLRKAYKKHPDVFTSEDEYWNTLCDYYIEGARLCWHQISPEYKKEILKPEVDP